MENQKPTILTVLKALSRLVFRFWLIVTVAVTIYFIIQNLQSETKAIADLDLPHFAGVSVILLAMATLLRQPATLFR
jgi:hypothetical protein